MRTRFLMAALAAVSAAVNVLAATRIVLGDNAASASTSFANRDPKYAVNGAGLVGNLHSNTADKISWMSATQSGSVSGQWFRVDLGQVVELERLKLWNFNFYHATASTTNRGIKDAEVYVSALDSTPGTDFADAAHWTRVIDKVSFAKAPALNTYEGEPDVSLSGVQGRWLALRILSNHSSTDFTVGISELQVFAADKPVVLSRPPASVAAEQAVLPGVLTYDGGQPCEVFAFWGTTDGGAVSSGWQHVLSLGYPSTGTPFFATAAASPNAEYFFRFHAASAATDNWSAAGSFLTAPVSVEMPTTVQESAAPVTVTFRRPAALTNSNISLTFALSGSAVAGSDYALGSTSVVIQAGSSTLQARIALIDDLTVEANKTLTVGLGPSACLIDASSTNTTIIVDDDGPLDRFAWHRFMRVSIPGYAGASTLTNFPVPIRLHEGLSGFRYSDFASPLDGGDLRVANASTDVAVPFEIETWDPSGTSVVWACVSSLAGASTALNLYWGNDQVGLPQYATNGLSWGSGFGGVWHLQQPHAPDSTTNRNAGAAVGNVTAPGMIGSGQYFDGSNDYIVVADSPSIGTNVVSSLTVSLWLKSDATLERTNEVWRMLEKGDDYFLSQGYNNMGGAQFLVKRTNMVYAAGNGAEIPSNVWCHLCGTYDGAVLRLYTNGVLAGSKALAPSIDDDKLPLRIGSDDNGKFFRGVLDETRVESAVRSPDWIKACYDSQREDGAFITYRPAVSLFGGTLFGVR